MFINIIAGNVGFDFINLYKSIAELILLIYVLAYLLTSWSRVLEKLTGLQLVKKFRAFMEPKGSLPHSQVTAIYPCPEPHRFSPCPHIPLREDPS
jgi:hypothetical protein